jgi:hypothetical protein
VLRAPEDEGADLARRAARCIACGACDRAFEPWKQVPRERFFGPMHFALTAGRGPSGWALLGVESTALARGDLARLEQLCPVDVPFDALVRAVQHRAPPVRHAARTKRHDPG